MEEELIRFCRENGLKPFNSKKTNIKKKNSSIFKTNDGKTIHNKVLDKISRNFIFADTENLLNLFSFTESINEIKKRQEFFSRIEKITSDFLKQLTPPKQTWKPKYEVIVVTENEKTYLQLNNLNCPVRFISSIEDISDLESYDLVQAIECENCQYQLESLPHTIFLDSEEEAYLERYLEILSGWKKNIEVLKANKTSQSIDRVVNDLDPLLKLIKSNHEEKLDEHKIESVLERINSEISSKIRELSISGDSLIALLSKSKLPEEFERIIEKAIKNSNAPEHLFTISIPVKIDEVELEKFLKEQNSNEFISAAEKIKKNAKEIVKIPEKIKELEENLLIFDFVSGISKFKEQTESFPEVADELIIEKSRNLFLERPQPVSFSLTKNHRCSILTGANSGGKTTLLEHIIQLTILFQLGLPVSGKVKMPIFSDVYYFAKNKGSMSKGAFETMLTQMSKIKPGNKTLILADEMEAVTEPGVAGRIICATADYFIKKQCFLVIATHLGQEIIKSLPEFSRVDGIEAKGLNDNFELIVDHNPVLGKLASSTPELIVEKMSKLKQEDYFEYLQEYLKREK